MNPRFHRFEVVMAMASDPRCLLWMILPARTPKIAARWALESTQAQEKINFELGHFDTCEEYRVVEVNRV